MGLVAEFEIHCEGLPLVEVARSLPDASVLLELQYNHGRRPLFLITVTEADHSTTADALTDAYDVGEWSFVGQAGDTRRYQAHPALSFAEQLGDHVDDLAGLEALATVEAIVERIEVVPQGWRQRGWFADRDAFRQFLDDVGTPTAGD